MNSALTAHRPGVPTGRYAIPRGRFTVLPGEPVVTAEKPYRISMNSAFHLPRTHTGTVWHEAPARVQGGAGVGGKNPCKTRLSDLMSEYQ